MKTRFHAQGDRTSMDSMLTPMIDVVFLLLIFFLTTSSFQRLEKLLPSAVSAESKSQAGNAADEIPEATDSDLSDCIIKLRLEQNGVRYQLNEETMDSLATLTGRMKAIIRIRPDLPIVIDPSDDVAAKDAIQVYDLAKSAGSLAVYLVGR